MALLGKEEGSRLSLLIACLKLTLALCLCEKCHQFRSYQFRRSSKFDQGVHSSLPLDNVIVWAIVGMVVT